MMVFILMKTILKENQITLSPKLLTQKDLINVHNSTDGTTEVGDLFNDFKKPNLHFITHLSLNASNSKGDPTYMPVYFSRQYIKFYMYLNKILLSTN